MMTTLTLMMTGATIIHAHGEDGDDCMHGDDDEEEEEEEEEEPVNEV